MATSNPARAPRHRPPPQAERAEPPSRPDDAEQDPARRDNILITAGPRPGIPVHRKPTKVTTRLGTTDTHRKRT